MTVCTDIIYIKHIAKCLFLEYLMFKDVLNIYIHTYKRIMQ
jgi:hypothetical protein